MAGLLPVLAAAARQLERSGLFTKVTGPWIRPARR
jgi:hypothetical protein